MCSEIEVNSRHPVMAVLRRNEVRNRPDAKGSNSQSRGGDDELESQFSFRCQLMGSSKESAAVSLCPQMPPEIDPAVGRLRNRQAVTAIAKLSADEVEALAPGKTGFESARNRTGSAAALRNAKTSWKMRPIGATVFWEPELKVIEIRERIVDAWFIVIGKTVAHYQVVELLGERGMGKVYRAADTRLKREVALKVLPEACIQDPERLTRFRREAEVLAALSHPNIGAILGIEPFETSQVLVLELIEGQDLSDIIRQGPLAENEALDIALQIARAHGCFD